MNPNTQLKIFKFLEKLWLVAACIGVAFTVYFLVVHDNDSALFFFGFFILSGLLYILRKRQRVKHQKQIEDIAKNEK